MEEVEACEVASKCPPQEPSLAQPVLETYLIVEDPAVSSTGTFPGDLDKGTDYHRLKSPLEESFTARVLPSDTGPDLNAPLADIHSSKTIALSTIPGFKAREFLNGV